MFNPRVPDGQELPVVQAMQTVKIRFSAGYQC